MEGRGGEKRWRHPGGGSAKDDGGGLKSAKIGWRNMWTLPYVNDPLGAITVWSKRGIGFGQGIQFLGENQLSLTRSLTCQESILTLRHVACGVIRRQKHVNRTNLTMPGPF